VLTHKLFWLIPNNKTNLASNCVGTLKTQKAINYFGRGYS
jgi:hypothetical protein